MIAISGAKVRSGAEKPYFCARNRDHGGAPVRQRHARIAAPLRLNHALALAQRGAIAARANLIGTTPIRRFNP
jgi:hypothetical protein